MYCSHSHMQRICFCGRWHPSLGDLTGTLKSVINTHKSRVVKTDNCEFLGFTFQSKKLRWSERTNQDFCHGDQTLTQLCALCLKWKAFRVLNNLIR